MFVRCLKQGCGLIQMGNTRYILKNDQNIFYYDGITLYAAKIMGQLLCEMNFYKDKCVTTSKPITIHPTFASPPPTSLPLGVVIRGMRGGSPLLPSPLYNTIHLLFVLCLNALICTPSANYATYEMRPLGTMM